MPIWRGMQATPSNGAQIHLKYKMLGGGDAYASEAAGAVAAARVMIREIRNRLANGPRGLTADQLQVLDYYFVCGGAPISGSDFKIISDVLAATANGLLGDGLNLKLSAGESGGYVRLHSGFFGKPKNNWTLGRSEGRRTHRGDIHIGTKSLGFGPGHAAMILIHEATHKFASTADFGEEGYTYLDTGLFREPGLTHAEALNNADSYACFVGYSCGVPLVSPPAASA